MKIFNMSEQEKKPNVWVFTPEAMQQFVEVLKASCLYEPLLSEFENHFMYDTRHRYSKFKDDVAFSHKQMLTLTEIAAKLNVPYNLLLTSQ